MAVILIVALAWIVAACFTVTVARAKGYDAGTWLLGGLAFGFLALVAVCGMPLRRDIEPL